GQEVDQQKRAAARAAVHVARRQYERVKQDKTICGLAELNQAQYRLQEAEYRLAVVERQPAAVVLKHLTTLVDARKAWVRQVERLTELKAVSRVELTQVRAGLAELNVQLELYKLLELREQAFALRAVAFLLGDVSQEELQELHVARRALEGARRKATA